MTVFQFRYMFDVPFDLSWRTGAYLNSLGEANIYTSIWFWF